MKKILSILLIIGYAFSINGTITFYDGSTLEGELSYSDVKNVFIIPNGLVTPEKVPVVDIDNFKLENGLTLIESGITQQIFVDGKFSLIKKETTEEFSDAENDKYEGYDLGNLDYLSISAFYGIPVYFRPSLLLEDGKAPKSLPNLGFDFSLPYFPVGSINMSAGVRLLTFGFDKVFNSTDALKKIKSITIAGILKSDLQPILNFLGENIHPNIETGITYSLGWQEDYAGGLGIVVGGTLDYWFEDSPVGLRIFGNGYMIPSPENSLTGFGNIGASLLLSLKRNE